VKMSGRVERTKYEKGQYLMSLLSHGVDQLALVLIESLQFRNQVL
jgi:hypothetical protein